MLEKIRYVNHAGESLSFGSAGLFANASDLRDWEWSYDTNNDRISRFYHKVTDKTLPVVIREDDRASVLNRLYEVTERDRMSREHGRLYIGDWYIYCYVTASKKTEYLSSELYAILSLTVTTDDPLWRKESIFAFLATNPSGATTYKAYPYHYPYQYGNSLIRSSLTNQAIAPCKFRMILYGPCANPSVYIDGHEYNVNVTLLTGQRLTIDSLDKTILTTDVDGIKTNCFYLRNRDSYIFEPIPVGTIPFTRSDNFGVDLILTEERSEPKWT